MEGVAAFAAAPAVASHPRYPGFGGTSWRGKTSRMLWTSRSLKYWGKGMKPEKQGRGWLPFRA